LIFYFTHPRRNHSISWVPAASAPSRCCWTRMTVWSSLDLRFPGLDNPPYRADQTHRRCRRKVWEPVSALSGHRRHEVLNILYTFMNENASTEMKKNLTHLVKSIGKVSRVCTFALSASFFCCMSAIIEFRKLILARLVSMSSDWKLTRPIVCKIYKILA